MLISCLIKHYTRKSIKDIRGPITVVAGKRRRITFVVLKLYFVCTVFVLLMFKGTFKQLLPYVYFFLRSLLPRLVLHIEMNIIKALYFFSLKRYFNAYFLFIL